MPQRRNLWINFYNYGVEKERSFYSFTDAITVDWDEEKVTTFYYLNFFYYLNIFLLPQHFLMPSFQTASHIWKTRIAMFEYCLLTIAQHSTGW